MPLYTMEMIDEIWTIFKDGNEIGRVISQRDGNAIVDELRIADSEVLRDRLLSAVTDAIEEAFDGKTP